MDVNPLFKVMSTTSKWKEDYYESKNNGRHMFEKMWKNLVSHARWAIGISIEKLVNPFYFLENNFNGT
jgi:hypothetical protein